MHMDIQKLPGEVADSLVALDRSHSMQRDTLDSGLIERIAKADKLAMLVLFTRHNVRVYRFALRFVHDEGLAEDLVNEVFFEVWQKAGKFEGRSQVSTWLLAITRHKALEIARRRRTVCLDEETWEAIEDVADNAEAEMHKKQQRAVLFDCISKLTPSHREIVDLVYYHGKSIDEVAEIVGVPRNTVKSRMFYARQQLKGLLAAKGVVAA